MYLMTYMREKRRLTRKAIAQLAGLPQCYVNWIENGQWNPSDEQRAKIAAVLELDPADLLREITVTVPRETHTIEAVVR